MAARFCANCGAGYVENARFCTKCGQRRPGTGGSFPHWLTRYPAVFVVGSVVAIGALTVAIGHSNSPPPPNVPARNPQPPGSAESQAPGMPSDHPPVEIPADAKAAMDELQKTADSKPQDADSWRHLANVLYRASQIDRSYLDKADAAFQHLLEIVPEDLEALRSLGNIAFDREQHDVAIGYYQRYLNKKPDDLSVQTDLGTMYLSKGDAARAVRTYDAVLKADPNFFQAQVNLAIAYRSVGQADAARGAMLRAKEIAPDEETKAQVEKLLSRMPGATPGAEAAPAAAAAPAGVPAPGGNFRDNVEAIFKQHQILASKVQRIDWQDDHNAKVYLNEFPMDQMPESMRSMFLERMKDRLRKQKESSGVSVPLHIELVDFASGRVMETISE